MRAFQHDVLQVIAWLATPTTPFVESRRTDGQSTSTHQPSHHTGTLKPEHIAILVKQMRCAVDMHRTVQNNELQSSWRILVFQLWLH